MTSGAGARLNELLVEAQLATLDESTAARFEAYLSLIIRWNAKINLTAVREEESILSRHFVESILCARALPPNLATLLDFGSGAGLPGIPIALCQPAIAVTLAESQKKKAAFLHEAVRVLNLSTRVYSGRAETLDSTFDCVVLRAVDRMTVAVKTATSLVRQEGWLALLTTKLELNGLMAAAGTAFTVSHTTAIPGSTERVLVLAKQSALEPHPPI
jgi:16S rRNA (guanine527-N7)-methyltransferase